VTAQPAVAEPAVAPRPRPWRGGVTIFAICCYLAATYGLAHGTLYTQGLVLVAAVFAVLALSLDLVAGVLGLYSLGHAGLFALGAYTTTLLYTDHGWNLFVLLPVCIVGVGAVGLVLGALSLRVSGLYFAITTFVFTLLLGAFASDLSWTGGYGGLVGPQFPGFPGGLGWLGKSVIWCSLLVLGVAILINVGLRRSPLYPVLLAIRDAEPFAAAAGVRTSMVKICMFGLSAAMAGAAGWVFSFQGIVSPGQFNGQVAVNILAMVILGGINTTLGPILGAAFISIFPVEVSINAFWQEVLFGGLFVLVIIAYPAGFVGLLRALGRRAWRAWRPGEPAAAPAVAAVSGTYAAPIETASIEAAARAGAEHPDAVPVTVAQAASPNSVECRGIEFAYTRGAPVLHGVDLTVRRGTIHGLIGPNGSGKSTLVDLIAGRLRPLSGTILLDGRPADRGGPPARARRGFMRTFQAAVLVRELAVRDNVAVGYAARLPHLGLRAPLWPALPRAQHESRTLRRRSHDALAFVGAQTWSPARVANVPHGVEQLTQLAAATVAGPTTVILDEPLAGLSPTEVEHMAAILAELKSAGVSVILIEHQPRFVFALCDEVTVLAAGEVVATGTAAEVRADERVREVYLGE
jgi:ABC-type branched-subunit amino acid transport system ATPase component/ABC-type branched-subunit amino acid transport system permease subunit